MPVIMEGVEWRFYQKYHDKLDDPEYMAKRIQRVVAQMNSIKNNVQAYNYLADEHDALNTLYSIALTRAQKKEDERRLKEFYEVLIPD